jgi:hypothetical protein
MAAVGAFPYAGAESRDAAAELWVAKGGHSAVVSAANGGTGVVLAEIYDAAPRESFTAATRRLVNVSVLKPVGDGLTVGFVVEGSGRTNVLIRAVGPTLSGDFGIAGALSDPEITLYSGRTKIATNDNWGGGSDLRSAFEATGAFVLPPSSRDAALIAGLGPGNYTVHVSGVPGAEGLVLAEIYELP